MINPSEQLEDITVMIAEARGAVFNGKSIDMTEIQELIKEVCEGIQQTPSVDGDGIQDKVVSLITDLNLLVEELKVQQKQAEDNAIKKDNKKNQAET